MNGEDEDTRKTKVVRIVKTVYKKAMAIERENHFDEGSWFSYLIMKGLEKIKEEKE